MYIVVSGNLQRERVAISAVFRSQWHLGSATSDDNLLISVRSQELFDLLQIDVLCKCTATDCAFLKGSWMKQEGSNLPCQYGGQLLNCYT
eukprot:5350978-Amphidinium_carterae.2